MIPFPGNEADAPAESDEALPDYGDDLDGEFEQAVLEAFPELSSEQIGSLKAAIEACVEAKSSKKSSAPKGKKPGGLALIFGKGK